MMRVERRTTKGRIAARACALGVAALVGAAPGADAQPTINGAFFGDGDYTIYNLMQQDTSGGARGALFYHFTDNTMYLALVTNKYTNDNVCGLAPTDDAYMLSAAWTNGKGAVNRSCKKLTDSEYASFTAECTGDASPEYSFEISYAFDHDGDEDPFEDDWRGDPLGGPGSDLLGNLGTYTPNFPDAGTFVNDQGTPSTADDITFQFATSWVYNLNQGTYDLTLGGTRVGIKNWKSPDNGFVNDVTDDNYDIDNNCGENDGMGGLQPCDASGNFDDDANDDGAATTTDIWEWPMVYEFSFTWAPVCTSNSLIIDPGTAHHSPPKDSLGNDVPFDPPPEICVTCDTTYASVASFRALPARGGVTVQWTTDMEAGTAGFHLERRADDGGWVRVTDALLPALLTSPGGGTYRYVDTGASAGEALTYRLIEQELSGHQRVLGPYAVRAAGRAGPEVPDGFDRAPRSPRPAPKLTANRGARGGIGQGRLGVREPAIVRVPSADLAATFGGNARRVASWIREGQVRVTEQGDDVAWTAAPDGDGILFYGQGIDSLYTLDNVYWVAKGKGKTMRSRDGGSPAPAPGGSFEDTVVAEEDAFPATVAAEDPESEYWFWSAFLGGQAGIDTAFLPVEVADVVDGVSVEVGLYGATEERHPVEVLVNGQPVASGNRDGRGAFTVAGAIPSGVLQSGLNLVEVVGGAGDGANIVYVDRVAVTYDRAYRAVDDVLLAGGNGDVVTIEGFTAADVQVFDVSDPAAPRRMKDLTVEGAGGSHSVSFESRRDGEYLAVATAAIEALTPTPADPKPLSRSGEARYVVVAPEALAGAAAELAELREAGGLSARVVTVEEIQDQFAGGLSTPHAIREFVGWAKKRWRTRYVALVGTATLDYRGNSVPGENLVPTLLTSTPWGIFSCDNCLGDTDDDGLLDVAIGRIPAATPEDVLGFVAKLREHERQAPVRSRGVGLLAGADEGAVGRFPADSLRLVDHLPEGTPVERVFVDELPGGNGARLATLGLLNRGELGWVNYMGHGGSSRLGATPDTTFLQLGDGAFLSSQGSFPVLTALACAVNRIELPGFTSLGEELVLDPDGGAIAVWGASSLVVHGMSRNLGNEIVERVYNERTERIGDAVLQTLRGKRGDAIPFVLQVYSLVGDPATSLR